MTVTDVPQLSRAEHQRRALHRSVDRVCDAWPHARLDADARGFPSGGGGRGPVGGHSDPTPGAALAEHGADGHAVAWLAQFHDVVTAMLEPGSRVVWEPEAVRRLLHPAVEELIAGWPGEHEVVDALHQLADLAGLWWPKDPKVGQRVGGVTVGRRGNDVEVCALCKEPVVTGRSVSGQPLTRRIDGEPYHNLAEGSHGACWWQVWRSRHRGA